MNVRKKLRKSNWIYFWVVSILLTTKIAYTQGISTDGTIGAAQTLTGANVSIPQTLGKTAGNNLFHSFADFNIDKGQTVIFTGADNLQNVISRVTGDNKSIIDGTLKSDIKNADFYFINPNGITFGSGASVDMPAAFHVTTADKMDFGKNGGVFYADKSKSSSLSSESPAALGFLGTSKVNNGLIDFDGSQLDIKEGQIVDVIAGEIIMNNAVITSMRRTFTASEVANIPISTIINDNLFNQVIYSKTGEIRLIAIQSNGSSSLLKTIDNFLPLPNQVEGDIKGGKISINSGTIDMSESGSGLIKIFGGDISVSKSSLNANTYENSGTNSNEVNILANNLSILDNSYVSSSFVEHSLTNIITIKDTASEVETYWRVRLKVWGI